MGKATPAAVSARAGRQRRTTAGGRLKDYYAKRDLERSGEPAQGGEESGSAAVARFVIQKHDATRLHYDLRLEMDGVLKSWAVPKGLPEEPGQRALAVEVEDHPLDYGGFEGVIPTGNYGAGTVMLWDRGAYTVGGGDASRALRQGKIHFALAGEKCTGEWTLVRTRRGQADKVEWLVIKNRDRSRRVPIKRAGRDRSVLTRRTLDQITAAENVPAAKGTGPARKTVMARRASAAPPSSAPGPPDAFVEPMKALASDRLPEGAWSYEIKFDGYRALAVLGGGGEPTLWSRNAKRFTEFGEVEAGLRELGAVDAVLDGEVVALDGEGRPRFQLLQGLAQAKERPPLFFYVFDLLRHNGVSLLGRPIEERRERLRTLLRRTPAALRLSPVFDGDPQSLLAEVRRKGLEGLIAKAAGSVYEAGRRSGAWTKYRLAREQEFVIGGFTPPSGTRRFFGAILVGYRDGRTWRYAGKVGTGFNQRTLAALHGEMERRTTGKCPFINLPMPRTPRFGVGMTAAAMREVTWIKPELVAQVRFSEWTREDLLRHPVYLGLRQDKRARDVVREALAAEDAGR